MALENVRIDDATDRDFPRQAGQTPLPNQSMDRHSLADLNTVHSILKQHSIAALLKKNRLKKLMKSK